MVFLGMGRHVVCLEPETGNEIWRTDLCNGAIFGAIEVTVLEGDEVVLAAQGGELHCLDKATGAIRWKNPLKGLGYGNISMAGFGQTVQYRYIDTSS